MNVHTVRWLLGWGFPQLCTASLTNNRLYETISLTNTHCLNRKIDGKNGKVRADSSAAFHRKYRTATDLNLTLSSLTHTDIHRQHKQGLGLTSAHTNMQNVHAYVNMNTCTHTLTYAYTQDEEQEQVPHKHLHIGYKSKPKLSHLFLHR